MSEYGYLDHEGFEGSRWSGPEQTGSFTFPPKATGLSRMRHGATVLGIPLDVYLQHREQGEQWCGYHRAWEPVERFGTHLRRGRRIMDGSCPEGLAAASRERYAKRMAARRGDPA